MFEALHSYNAHAIEETFEETFAVAPLLPEPEFEILINQLIHHLSEN
jgi:hypothetical protein